MDFIVAIDYPYWLRPIHIRLWQMMMLNSECDRTSRTKKGLALFVEKELRDTIKYIIL